MMVDHCTQNEQNPHIHLRYTNKSIQNAWHNGPKGYILAQSLGIFYMHQCPIVVDYVPNVKKINSFVSEILP